LVDLSYASVLVAALMPYLFVGYAKCSAKGYDNRRPREFFERVEGRAKRAHSAHLNSFEAFPIFAAAVIIAHLRQIPLHQLEVLSVLFVLFRMGYGWCYIMDLSLTRSVFWFLAFACCIILYILAILS
jgi:uncharacterized MAPEG superfamily protein